MKNTTNIRKIVYLVSSPFCKRDFDRFGVEIFQKRFGDVEIWDCSPFLSPKKNSIPIVNPISYKQHKVFNTEKTLLNEIKKYNDSEIFYFNILTFEYHTRKIFRLLRNKKHDYAIPYVTMIPMPQRKKRALFEKISRISKASLHEIIWKLTHQVFSILPVARIAFCSGEKVTPTSLCKSKEMLLIHALDYDLYLEELKNPLQRTKKPMAVFLDQYIPFHPDTLDVARKIKPVDPAQYYKKINRFLDYIENEFGLEVVIAEHPRSISAVHEKYWGQRKKVRGETISLVRASELVITHASTALNFAALFEIPFVAVTMTEMDTVCAEDFYNNEPLINALGKQYYSIDSDITLSKSDLYSINKEAYAKYISNYIKKEGTDKKPFWEVAADWYTKAYLT